MGVWYYLVNTTKKEKVPGNLGKNGEFDLAEIVEEAYSKYGWKKSDKLFLINDDGFVYPFPDILVAYLEELPGGYDEETDEFPLDRAELKIDFDEDRDFVDEASDYPDAQIKKIASPPKKSMPIIPPPRSSGRSAIPLPPAKPIYHTPATSGSSSYSSSSSKSSSPSVSHGQCEGVTQKGTRCSRPSKAPGKFCYQHGK